MPENNSYDEFGEDLGTVVSVPFKTSESRRSLARKFLAKKGLKLTDSVFHRNSKLENAIHKTTYNNKTKAKMMFIARVPVENASFLNWLKNSGIAKLNRSNFIIELTTKENGKKVKRIHHVKTSTKPSFKKTNGRRGPVKFKLGRDRPTKKNQKAKVVQADNSMKAYGLSVHRFLMTLAKTTDKPWTKSDLYNKFCELDASRSKEVFDMVCKSTVQLILESHKDTVLKTRLCFMYCQKISKVLEAEIEQKGDLELSEGREIMRFQSIDGSIVFEVKLNSLRNGKCAREVIYGKNEPMEQEYENFAVVFQGENNEVPVLPENFAIKHEDNQEYEQQANVMEQGMYATEEYHPVVKIENITHREIKVEPNTDPDVLMIGVKMTGRRPTRSNQAPRAEGNGMIVPKQEQDED